MTSMIRKTGYHLRRLIRDLREDENSPEHNKIYGRRYRDGALQPTARDYAMIAIGAGIFAIAIPLINYASEHAPHLSKIFERKNSAVAESNENPTKQEEAKPSRVEMIASEALTKSGN